MKFTDDSLAKRVNDAINYSSSGAFDLLTKEAERQRKQLYDLTCPNKQLLEQLSSAGMMKAAYADSMALAAINQNALDALALPSADSVRLATEMVSQKAIDALCMNTAASAALNFNTAKAMEQVMGSSLASEAAKLSRNSVADIEKRLFLNSAAELEKQLFPFQDYSRNNSSFYLPSDSFVIRSSPKTSRQEERLTESKRRDEAENTRIITSETDTFKATLNLLRNISIEKGISLPISEEDIPMYVESLHYAINKPTTEKQINTDNLQNKGRRQRQIDRILGVINNLGCKPMCIPKGYKKLIEAECLKDKENFTAAGFEHAWDECNRQKVIRVEGYENYRSNQ